VKNICKEYGVELVRLPPYHCEFNPIEKIWGWLKNQLKSVNKLKNKLEVVIELSKQSLADILDSVIQGAFKYIRDQEEKVWISNDLAMVQPFSPIIINLNDNDLAESDMEESDSDCYSDEY